MRDEEKTKVQLMTELATARRRVAELEALAINWEESQEQREAALRQYAAQLQASNKELDAFAHTVARDLKSPLAAISNLAELLAESYASITTPKLRNYSRVLLQITGEMQYIIEKLVLLAEIRKEVKVEPLDMAGIVAHARQRLADLLQERQASFTLPTLWPPALGYAPWIEEVWVSYISKGTKYGGQPPHLELGVTLQSGGIICYWLKDNGPGLTPDEQQQLFNTSGGGMLSRAKDDGLDLSIIRRIVENLGGKAIVTSEAGQGNCFSFTLPVAG
jgi:light-regulated signal transduction histidine kinase (bacteriophytochrome)